MVIEPRRATSADVAARAGVSRTTVSFVLNDRPGANISSATRERVFAAATELGYHAHASARTLAVGKSHTLGLVLRQSAEQVASDQLLAETLRGLVTAARAATYRVLVEPLMPGDGVFIDLLRSRRADGLVISGPRVDDPGLADLTFDGFPIVLQGSLPGVEIPSVDVDNMTGARGAVEYLLRTGHRRIACITNAPLEYTAARERRDGYRAALEANGIAYVESLVVQAAFDAASGSRAMTELLARTTFDAVFVASDVVALGAIGALRRAGLRVPTDVSIVGFDDIALAAFFDPPLTTVHVPAYDLGLAAGRALLDRIGGRPVPSRTLLPTEFVVRSSTADRRALSAVGGPAP
ncbi:MAG TPA: LacI family DNA-binding transcriptional regulator [Candidatus Limnocylindrales bacterium]|jgi:LacI family transcriptional regulator